LRQGRHQSGDAANLLTGRQTVESRLKKRALVCTAQSLDLDESFPETRGRQRRNRAGDDDAHFGDRRCNQVVLRQIRGGEPHCRVSILIRPQEVDGVSAIQCREDDRTSNDGISIGSAHFEYERLREPGAASSSLAVSRHDTNRDDIDIARRRNLRMQIIGKRDVRFYARGIRESAV
jgi:hypothetical protein